MAFTWISLQILSICFMALASLSVAYDPTFAANNENNDGMGYSSQSSPNVLESEVMHRTYADEMCPDEETFKRHLELAKEMETQMHQFAEWQNTMEGLSKALATLEKQLLVDDKKDVKKIENEYQTFLEQKIDTLTHSLYSLEGRITKFESQNGEKETGEGNTGDQVEQQRKELIGKEIDDNLSDGENAKSDEGIDKDVTSSEMHTAEDGLDTTWTYRDTFIGSAKMIFLEIFNMFIFLTCSCIVWNIWIILCHMLAIVWAILYILTHVCFLLLYLAPFTAISTAIVFIFMWDTIYKEYMKYMLAVAVILILFLFVWMELLHVTINSNNDPTWSLSAITEFQLAGFGPAMKGFLSQSYNVLQSLLFIVSRLAILLTFIAPTLWGKIRASNDAGLVCTSVWLIMMFNMYNGVALYTSDINATTLWQYKTG